MNRTNAKIVVRIETDDVIVVARLIHGLRCLTRIKRDRHEWIRVLRLRRILGDEDVSDTIWNMIKQESD
jgi:hypothetical protein